MFGGFIGSRPRPVKQDNETEVEKLSRELAEALARIEELRDALGSNHPSGRIGGLF